MTRIQKFKKQLARIFDNDLRTKQGENYLDYVIIGLIVLLYGCNKRYSRGNVLCA